MGYPSVGGVYLSHAELLGAWHRSRTLISFPDTLAPQGSKDSHFPVSKPFDIFKYIGHW